jgi:3-phosphoshikimate 1-carboxyvinyltransferase
MSDLTLEPVRKPFSAEFTPPGSKSLTNRALAIAALAKGQSTLGNCLFADDTRVMIDSLVRLGFRVDVNEPESLIVVHGNGGEIPNREAELYCGNSGTSTRFLTAMCSVGRGRYLIDGNARMRQRPIGQLAEMLRNLGVRINYPMQQGFPPVEVLADGLPGGMVRFGDAESSQFLSAALLACPYARNEVSIDLEGAQTSWPYVAMTMQLMDHFGSTAELYRDPKTGLPKQIHVPRGGYAATDYHVEPDASNASYFLAAAALHPGSKVTINGLGKRSLQGDVAFADVLHRMGADLIFGGDFITIAGTDVLSGIDIDMRDMPDMAQTLAVVALFAEGESVLRGLHTLRKKETDRIAALATELKKFNAQIDVEEDTLTITPPEHMRHASVDTYDDHRMAMSFALAGTKIEHVTIRDVECVNKTYPRFFEDLRKVLGQQA